MTQSARGSTYVDEYVGRQLKLFRKAAGLTQVDLAGQIGITFQQVQKYERGVNRIGASRLWELCGVLNVSPSDFFDGLKTQPVARSEAISPLAPVA